MGAAGDTTFPICTFSYMYIHETQLNGESARLLEAFATFVLSDEGQGMLAEFGFVKLAADTLAKSRAALNQVTWGTSPEDVAPITGNIPHPDDFEDDNKREAAARSLEYMGLTAGEPLSNVAVDTVFIGSCTNGRIEDLRAVAEVAKGRRVKDGVRAMVVPGSGLVKAQAEEEGLAAIFREAGFDWREPGCSMCLAMNDDKLAVGERAASTSNRNFEGRQGRGGRTHLVSPAMAAAAAITGHLTDVRDF